MMKNYFYPILTLLTVGIVLLLGCKPSKFTYIEVPTLVKNKILQVDTAFKIQVADSLSWKYKSVLKTANATYLLVCKRRSIHKINLQSGVTERIMLDTAITNESHGDVSSIFAHTADSIFLLQEDQLVIVDGSGKPKLTIPINRNEARRHQTGNLADFPIYYDRRTRSIYAEQYSMVFEFCERKYFEKWREVSINIDTQKLDSLAIPYSNLYKQGNYYGFAILDDRGYTDSLHLYTFTLDPNIYVYNKFTKQMKVFGGRSAYHTSKSIPTMSLKDKDNTEKKMQHLTVVPLYFKMTYDVKNKVYLRLFSTEVPLQNPDGTYNVFSDKKSYLQVFDEKFNLINEFFMPKGFYFLDCTTNEGALFTKQTKNGKQIFTLQFHEKK